MSLDDDIPPLEYGDPGAAGVQQPTDNSGGLPEDAGHGNPTGPEPDPEPNPDIVQPDKEPEQDDAVEASEEATTDPVQPKDQTAYRTLPHNVEAEKALLGAIFTNNMAYERVCDFLRAEHFAIPEHGQVYEAIQMRLEKGQVANPVTLSALFEGNDDLVALGGKRYLAELAASAVTIINTGEYGRMVYDLFMKRELIQLGTDMVNGAYDQGSQDTAGMMIEEADSRLSALVHDHTQDYMAPIGDVMGKTLDEIESAASSDGMAGLSTGLSDVDKQLGGLSPGDVLILAGDTSMGKTAAALGIAIHNAQLHKKTDGKEGAVVMFASLEMTSTQLTKRVLSRETGISSYALRCGNVKNWTALLTSSTRVNSLPFYIDETPGATVTGIRRRARRLKRKSGLGLLVVDYLQLITADRRYAGQRVSEVGQISRDLKKLAKELDVPLVVLSQLSRGLRARENPRPMMSDLRESGSIEQDADTILMMYRKEYYTKEKKPEKKMGEGDKFNDRMAAWLVAMEEQHGIAEVIIPKNRHGEAGASVEVHFDGPSMTFSNLQKDQ